MGDTMLNIFYTFLLYSVIGYLGEVVYCLLITKHLTNRGFMYGPVCPIYGFGAVFIVYVLAYFKISPFIVFSFGLLSSTLLEYVTSFLMEKTFHMKWWDYSKMHFTIKGRVCLINSLIFGVGSLLVVYYLHPLLLNTIYQIPTTMKLIFVISGMSFFVVDYFVSFYTARKIQRKMEQMREEYIQELKEASVTPMEHFMFQHFWVSYPHAVKKKY
jgi:uncharacterized membrane protein